MLMIKTFSLRCLKTEADRWAVMVVVPLALRAAGLSQRDNHHPAFAFAYFASFALCFFLLFTTATAVEPGKEILLWPNGAPGSEGKTGDEQVRIVNGERVV